MSARRSKDELAEWVTAVYEEAAAGNDGMGEPIQRPCAGVWMSTVQRADPYGEHDVVALLVGCEHEFLARHVADAQPAGSDQVAG